MSPQPCRGQHHVSCPILVEQMALEQLVVEQRVKLVKKLKTRRRLRCLLLRCTLDGRVVQDAWSTRDALKVDLGLVVSGA